MLAIFMIFANIHGILIKVKNNPHCSLDFGISKPGVLANDHSEKRRFYEIRCQILISDCTILNIHKSRFDIIYSPSLS